MKLKPGNIVKSEFYTWFLIKKNKEGNWQAIIIDSAPDLIKNIGRRVFCLDTDRLTKIP